MHSPSPDNTFELYPSELAVFARLDESGDGDLPLPSKGCARDWLGFNTNSDDRSQW